MAEVEQVDVVVVGAGIAGIACAKGYLQCGPDTNLVIIDQNKTVGGVWAEENVYPGLRTNNLRGTLEFPDFPFPDDIGAEHGEFLPGISVHRYLTRYAENFDLMRRIRFQTKVLAAEKLDNDQGWKLLIETPLLGQSHLLTKRLIIGTGVTSEPGKMTLPGQEEYGAPLGHSAIFAREGMSFLKDPSVKRVTIYGGSKYAWDSIYACASAGKQVDWVVRKSGHGPTFFAKIHTELPLIGRVWAERLVTTRFLTWFSPCAFGGLDGSSWWRKFLHGTWLGRKITKGYWDKVNEEMLKQGGFDNHPACRAIKPDFSHFDIGVGFATLNYPTDILQFLRDGQVKYHREDISHLTHHTVHLQNGTSLPSDILISSSGWEWRPTFPISPASVHADLGIPSSSYSPSQTNLWKEIDTRADEEILSRFPMLKSGKFPPNSEKEDSKPFPLDSQNPNQPNCTPQRLYHCIAPPGEASNPDPSARTLAFAGAGSNICHALKAEFAGAWTWAYFNGALAIDPGRDLGRDRTFYEAALWQRWSVLRYKYGFGKRFVDSIWDAVPWNDVLLRDLGVRHLRKKGNWLQRCWRETFEAYTMADYRGVVAEWLEMRRKGKGY